MSDFTVVDGVVRLKAGTATVGVVDQGAAGEEAWPVDGSGVTQPISATALPLPEGAATEETLGDVATAVANIPADPAKESGKLTTIDATLTAIKSTDGIKKITDPLPAGTNNIGDVDIASALPAGTNNIGDVDIASAIPAGTNEIGKVAQGTRAAAAAGWPVYLVDAVGNVVGIVLDGAIYRVQTQAKIVRASDGSYINPATQETLAAIKDTDGIKKIVDALPTGSNTIGAVGLNAGSNEIGKVAQGTRAAASGGWPEYIVDAVGNAVGVVLDGAVYRLQAEAKIARGASSLVHLDALDTTSGHGRLKATIYTPDGDAVSFGGAVAPDPSNIRNDFCKSSGSPNLNVNGSVTPVVFTYNADSTYDISLQEVKLVISANSLTFGTGYFGSVSGPLTNGVLIEVTANGNTGTVYNLDQNESFANFASPGGFNWVVSSKDMMFSSWNVGGGLKLHAGTADCVKVTVRDNLSSAALYFKCFVKGNLLG